MWNMCADYEPTKTMKQYIFEKNEDSYYIQEYIRLSRNYLEYFSGNDTTGDEDEINEEINKFLITDAFDKFRNNFGIQTRYLFGVSIELLIIFINIY